VFPRQRAASRRPRVVGYRPLRGPFAVGFVAEQSRNERGRDLCFWQGQKAAAAACGERPEDREETPKAEPGVLFENKYSQKGAICIYLDRDC
jgi:hypothetical protein